MAQKAKTRSAPGRRDFRWLALASALLLTVGGGVLYGRFSQRWGPPADLVAAAAQLEQMPRQFGTWKLAEELPIEKSALEMLECAAYVNRRYVNEATGHSISLAVLLGPPGPIAVHTPEICFSSRAYEIQSDRKEIAIETTTRGRQTFWSVDFGSRNALAEGLRVYYAWSAGSEWQAAASPRFQFATAPLLYKIQLAAPAAPRLTDDSPDSGRQFLEALCNSNWTLPAG